VSSYEIRIKDIINHIHNLEWNVSKIEKYLESIELSKDNTALSFIHIQNFTETLVMYPYPLQEQSIYQKHITPFIQLDLKQSLKEIQSYVERMYKTINIKRNPFESDMKMNFIKKSDFHFGDCLFVYDALKSNYSLLNIENTINDYRYTIESLTTKKITQKQICKYSSFLKKELKLDTEPIEKSTHLPIIEINFI